MGTIIVEAMCGTDYELEEDIKREIDIFDKKRQREKDALPLTDYEKMLLTQFLESLVP